MKNINMGELIKRTDSILEEYERQVTQDAINYTLEEDADERVILMLGLLIKQGSMDALKQLKFYHSLQGTKMEESE